jgi:ketosteroid isomerase-like protein
MKRQTIIGLLVSMALVFCFSAVPSGITASIEEDVLQVEKNFVKAHNTNDYELMCSLYWKSPKTSCFVPPQDNPFLIQGSEEIENGWRFLSEIPKGTYNISIHHPQVIMLKEDVAVIISYCNVMYTDPSTKEQSVDHIRHTAVVQKIGGKWLIVHDHGSNLSEK